MLLHPRRRVAFVPLAVPIVLAAALAAGCGREPATGPAALSASLSQSGAAVRAPDMTAARSRARIGHPWFPLTPGRYIDYRIRRLGEDPELSYVRATFGEPEMFFGRLASPFVYGTVPGLPVDDTFEGLRQYFSVSPDGALWSHGAQNNGVMSHWEPPLRQLLADPVPGESWVDTVFFESFFLGEPFFSNLEEHTWTLSPLAILELPGGRFRAARANASIRDAAPGGATLAASFESDGVLLRGPISRAPLVPLKGLWYARREGLVARDFPFGDGPASRNIVTFERIDEGFGPIPAPQPAP